MPYTPDIANIPDPIECDIEVDFSGDHDFATSTSLKSGEDDCVVITYSFTGGAYGEINFGLLNRRTLTKAGEQAPWQLRIDLVFTEGETADAHPLFDAAHGSDIAIRVRPKGAGTGNHEDTIIGPLREVGRPTPDPQGGVYTYYVLVSGENTAGVQA